MADALRVWRRGLARISPLGAATIGSAVTFLILVLVYKAGLTKELDHATFALFGTIESSTLDALGQADDELARVIPTFAAAGLMAFVLAWKGPRWAWIVPFFIGVTGMVEFFAKLGFGRGLRLGELLAAARELIGFRYHTGAGFPSGHVARSTFLAVMALPLFPAWVTVPLVTFAAVTFLARLYVEAHRLSDVAGGVALGVFAACAGLWLRAILDARSSRRARAANERRGTSPATGRS